jgi:hypothetical protein
MYDLYYSYGNGWLYHDSFVDMFEAKINQLLLNDRGFSTKLTSVVDALTDYQDNNIYNHYPELELI